MRGIPQKRDILVLLLLCLYTSSVSGSWGPNECLDNPNFICKEENCVYDQTFSNCPRTCLNCQPCRDLESKCTTDPRSSCRFSDFQKDCRQTCGYCTDRCIDQLRGDTCEKLVQQYSCDNSQHLRQNCKYSCKLCTPICKDIYTKETCERLKSFGLCKVSVVKFCRETCDACVFTTPTPPDICRDEKKNCQMSQCPNEYQQCRKTCGLCGCADIRTDCKYQMTSCRSLSWRRECSGSCRICECRDERSECQHLLDQCHDPKIRRECAYSCGACKMGLKDNIESEDCEALKQSFGCNGYYMKHYCSYTCRTTEPKCENILPGYLCQIFHRWKRCHEPYVREYCWNTCECR